MSESPVRRRPPGPADELDLVGIRDDPLAFLTELAAEYGDLCSHRTRGEVVWFVNRPDLVRHILKDNYTAWTKAGTPDDFMLTPLLGTGLLTSDGPTWERQRRLCAPAFRTRQVEAFDTLMTDAATDLADAWSEAARAGRPVRVDHDFTALTLRIVADALLGADLTAAGPGFGRAVDDINRFIGHFDGEPNASVVDDAAFRRLRGSYLAAQTFLERVVGMLVAARRYTGPPSDRPADLLDAMLAARDAHGDAFSDRELHDQVLTMVMAGHETTAKALSWTVHLLDRRPEYAAAVRAELAEVLGGRAPRAEDLPRLDLTRRCLEEAIRLYPPVWLISRRANKEDVLDGLTVPAGTLVCISPWTLHRHPRVWDAPEEFRPERFTATARQGRPAHAYVPFGGGPRVCIGQSFATTEAILVLATILQRLELRGVVGHPVVPEALVTLRPRDGLLMTPHLLADGGSR
ncbi:cytochrome P450 [Embleya sp. NBC_00888]|uniref:cytochrome P450 n=1 Tax=Embleya sp. NBC_00888 TaxID=2975960 RepID=UPI0038662603|nr:cytochrome P450 [Embleya sp. NBC_00888]